MHAPGVIQLSLVFVLSSAVITDNRSVFSENDLVTHKNVGFIGVQMSKHIFEMIHLRNLLTFKATLHCHLDIPIKRLLAASFFMLYSSTSFCDAKALTIDAQTVEPVV